MSNRRLRASRRHPSVRLQSARRQRALSLRGREVCLQARPSATPGPDRQPHDGGLPRLHLEARPQVMRMLKGPRSNHLGRRLGLHRRPWLHQSSDLDPLSRRRVKQRRPVLALLPLPRHQHRGVNNRLRARHPASLRGLLPLTSMQTTSFPSTNRSLKARRG